MPALDPAILNATVTHNDDGTADLDMADDAQEDDALAKAPHGANLAELLPDDVLNRISADLIEGIEADEESNAEWYEIVGRGLKLLALKPGERLDTPYPNAPSSPSPVLKEAVVRFASSASGELLPADGPVRCKINADPTPELEAKAQRKAAYMNFFLTEEDADYYDDYDQMLPMLGLYGHMYRKVYRDPLRGGVATSRYFTPWDIIVSAQATTTTGSYRVTQIEPVSQGDIARLQRQSWYRDIDLAPPSDSSTPSRRVQEQAEWRRPTDRPEDADYILYHCRCMIDIEGLEHETVDDDGEPMPSGIELPYLVTIERESGKILRLARNYDEADDTYKPIEDIVVYRYMPGLGFMGWGLIHLIGADADTLTVLRQQALTSFSFASFPGGLKIRGTKAEDSSVQLAPGQFAEIETGGQPIGNAVMALPYKDLPPSYGILQTEILTGAQRLGSIGDMAVGDAREDALPGTVIALIKRATQMEGSVIKRMHRAQRRELRLLANLIGQDDREEYPFSMNGLTGKALTADFEPPNADVSPVSDPNIPTQTERLSMAQATLTVAQTPGSGMSVRNATEDFLRTMGKTDQEIARLMPPPASGVPADPVTEFGMAQAGAPLKADPMQNHVAHIQAHMGQAAIPGVPPTIQNALMAHIGEHTAMFYAAEAQRLSGAQVPPPAQPGAPPAPPNPQQDAQVSAAVAAAAAALHQSMMQLMPPPVSADPLAQSKLDIEKLKLQQHSADAQLQEQSRARAQQVELIHLNETIQNDREDRAATTQNQQFELARDAARAHATTTQALIHHATSEGSNAADIAVAAHKTAQTGVSAHAGVISEAHKTEQARVSARAKPKGKRT